MTNKTIQKLDTFLRIKLQRMSKEELDEFFETNVVEYSGKFYSREKEHSSNVQQQKENEVCQQSFL